MSVLAHSLRHGSVAPRLVMLATGIIVAGSTGVSIACGWTVILLVVVGAGSLLVAIWGRPRVGFVVWLLSMVMIPEWVGVESLIPVPAYCLVAFAVFVASIAKSRVKFSSFDAYFIAFLLLALLASLYSGTNKALWAEMVIRWGVPFFAGRIIVAATGLRFAANAIAAILSLVGALAVVEMVFVWHPFVSWDFSSNLQAFQAWHTIQVRGGHDRSEWAFGHSIALGGSLSLAIPFVVVSTYRRVLKVCLLTAVGAGIVSTDSRGALLAGVLTGVLCLTYFIRSSLIRAGGLICTALAAVMMIPLFGTLVQNWALGKSAEERISAGYRDELYAQYMDGISWFGRSHALGTSSVVSIDSAVLRIGLQFGWIIVGLALIPLLLSVIRVVAGRSTVAELSIVGQTPLFATVALITQYQSLVFLIVGIAVSELLISRQRGEATEPASTELSVTGFSVEPSTNHSDARGQSRLTDKV